MRSLPDAEFVDLWNSIVVEPTIKTRLLAHAVLNYTLRPRVRRTSLPFHGVILLIGEPGTGKTSLARGLAARTAESVDGAGEFRFMEVDPHALTSSSLGKSQRAVTELFNSTIGEQVSLHPTIVLLDEVETLVADRTKMSLEANPIDVHRATDAALVQLDRLAEAHANLLFLATSNFPMAIDEAFVSRADLVLEIPLPNLEGRAAILRHALGGLAQAFPAVRSLAFSPSIDDVAQAAEGLDGRTVRKLVTAACARSEQTALDPGRLVATDLVEVARAAADAARQRKEVR